MVSYLTRIQSVMSKCCPKDDKGSPWGLISKRETEYTFEYAFSVPSGYSFLDLEKQIDALSATCGKYVSLYDRLGAVIVSVPKVDLPDRIDFNPATHLGKEIIFGYNVKQEAVKLNPINKHVLLAGAAGYGKTDSLRFYMLQVIHQEPNARLIVVDMKGCSFIPFEKHHLIDYTDNIEEAYYLITEAREEMKRRSRLIRSSGSRDIIKKLPSIYIIIDEFADIPPAPGMKKGSKNEEGTYNMGEKDFAEGCMAALSSLTRIGRELKVNVWLCTQYPLSSLIGPQIKANMINVVSLKLETPIQSQTVLENDLAYLLPSDKRGRAIVKNQGMIQVPYIGNDDRWEEILQPYAKEGKYDDNQTDEDFDNIG